MLMDEPFGAVDPIVRERLQNELLRLQEQLAKTILFVTHDIDEAIKMGDLVAVMQVGGHLAQFGPPEEILAEPGVGVRGPLRRRGPRPQAPVAEPRRRPRAAAGDHGHGRRRRRGGARRALGRRRSRYLLLVDDGEPADRLDRPATSIPTDGHV